MTGRWQLPNCYLDTDSSKKYDCIHNKVDIKSQLQGVALPFGQSEARMVPRPKFAMPMNKNITKSKKISYNHN